MNYQLEVQQIVPDSNGLMNVMLMVGTPTHIRQQMILQLPSSSNISIHYLASLQ